MSECGLVCVVKRCVYEIGVCVRDVFSVCVSVCV